MTERAPTTITAIIGGRKKTAFEVEALSNTGAHVRSEVTLRVGQRIDIVLADGGPRIEAEVLAVQSQRLLSDQADLRFIEVPPAARAQLAELLRKLDESGVAVDAPTVKQTDPDAEPPTVRRGK